MKKKITRVKQCAKCPWKKTTDPHDIPDGYSVERHKKLKQTIAQGINFHDELRVMSCHELNGNEGDFCLGWLSNQLGPGNNIGVRMRMLAYDLSELALDGEQHETFEDTLPKG